MRRVRKPVTIRDVAARAGVSIATVSNALRGKGKMRDETRRRVIETARLLGFHPQKRGPGAGRRKQSVLLLVEALSSSPERDAFVGAIIRGIARALKARGVELCTRIVDSEMVCRGIVPAELFHSETAGVIVLAGGDLTDEYIDEVARSSLPVVLVDNFSYHRPMHCITVDNVSAGYLATRHLIALGHRRIGVLRGPHKYKPLTERFLGYLQALEAHGLVFDPALAPPPAAGEVTKGYAQMQSLLRTADPPTAVFAVSDKTAFGALQAARELGVRVPEDVALVGCDDVPAAASSKPALTTVAVPREELGRLAVEKLFDLRDFPGQPPIRLSVPVRLVVRESCGARLRGRA